MRDVKVVRRGLKQNIDPIMHLRGRIEVEPMLEGLGIDLGYRVGPSQLMCHCPDWMGNHKNGDSNPSFGFNEDKLVYNCFVCGGGTLVDLVQKMLGCTLDDAVTYLEGYSNLTPMNADALVQRVNQIMHPQEERVEMPEYPSESIFGFRKIHPYLYERGITKDVIMKMNVGFDEAHAGITFPHYFQGKLLGWQTRHLAEDDYGAYLCDRESCLKKGKVPKYINTPSFPKQNTLYGYDQLKDAVRASGESYVIVVESPMTALYLMSLGFDQVVATFGAFSQEQGMLLLPFEKIFFWADNDAAGFTNAERAKRSLMKYSNLFFVPVVDGEKSDAANLLPEQVQTYLDNVYPASLFMALNKGGKLATLSALPNSNRE